MGYSASIADRWDLFVATNSDLSWKPKQINGLDIRQVVEGNITWMYENKRINYLVIWKGT
jgi:hypothetical protein